ncbi:MAG: AAA family ATPase [Gammaproteobacteria bacterium]|nr:AAA family ATPase [Gammaproteobacteria bacterium]MDH5660769.1 AAA family ATPase [Gammaproteobacteria bacterium]
MNKNTYSTQLKEIIKSANTIILGKEHELRLALTCILAKGHLLIEDLPGVGKTTLAHTMAQLLGLQFNRIQFTSDMLPADVLGISIFEQNNSEFTFHPGPIFCNVLLADEINRATPKTQSALLEAMEEHQVTLDGKTRELPKPFFVIATQNPSEQIGTFSLPESQLDRFLMSISLGYPDLQAERQLLISNDKREALNKLTSCLNDNELSEIQDRVQHITTSASLLDYVQALISYSRDSGLFEYGLSPRAGLALLHVSKAWAMLNERDYVVPEDVQIVLPCVVRHRLHPIDSASDSNPKFAIDTLLQDVAIP